MAKHGLRVRNSVSPNEIDRLLAELAEIKRQTTASAKDLTRWSGLFFIWHLPRLSEWVLTTIGNTREVKLLYDRLIAMPQEHLGLQVTETVLGPQDSTLYFANRPGSIGSLGQYLRTFSQNDLLAQAQDFLSTIPGSGSWNISRKEKWLITFMGDVLLHCLPALMLDRIAVDPIKWMLGYGVLPSMIGIQPMRSLWGVTPEHIQKVRNSLDPHQLKIGVQQLRSRAQSMRWLQYALYGVITLLWLSALSNTWRDIQSEGPLLLKLAFVLTHFDVSFFLKTWCAFLFEAMLIQQVWGQYRLAHHLSQAQVRLETVFKGLDSVEIECIKAHGFGNALARSYLSVTCLDEITTARAKSELERAGITLRLKGETQFSIWADAVIKKPTVIADRIATALQREKAQPALRRIAVPFLQSVHGIEYFSSDFNNDQDNLSRTRFLVRFAKETAAQDHYAPIETILNSVFPNAIFTCYGPYLEIAAYQIDSTQFDSARVQIGAIPGLVPAPTLAPAILMQSTLDPAQAPKIGDVRRRRSRIIHPPAGIISTTRQCISWEYKGRTIRPSTPNVVAIRFAGDPSGHLAHRLYALWNLTAEAFSSDMQYQQAFSCFQDGRQKRQQGYNGWVFNSAEGWKIKHVGQNLRVFPSATIFAQAGQGQRLMIMDDVRPGH